MENSPNPKSDQAKGNSSQISKNDRNLENSVPPTSGESSQDDDLEFVVIEKSEDGREFVGGQKQFPSNRGDELDSQITGDLADKEALPTEDRPEQLPLSGSDFQPIGETTPVLPQQPPYPASESLPEKKTEPLPPKQPPAREQKRTKKLSPEELVSIEKNLYGDSSYLTDQEKQDLINKIGKLDDSQSHERQTEASSKRAPVSTNASPETEADVPRPKMAERRRGIAYFYKNYIRILGSQELHEKDELYINTRCYELKPKRLNPKVIIGLGVALFALILFFVGSQFVSNISVGNGEIIGMVLDETGQPFVRQATIKFPELGKSVSSNAQGFFRSGPVPEGSHKIEYYVKNQLLKVDYATVVNGQITTLSLIPTEMESLAARRDKTSPQSPPSTPSANSSPQLSRARTTVQGNVGKRKNTRPNAQPTKKSIRKSPAKITLAANVEQARLTVDGNILGSGNLTYSKIEPGTHKYIVSKDGFQPTSGTIKLSPGQTKTLSLKLLPMDQSAKAEVYSDEDFYYSGLAALKKKDLETAISDLTEAINKRPSYAEAYFVRAEAYSLSREKELAYDDYVRAAEIFQIKKDLNKAITAFNNAIKLNKKSATAYLGRANAYLAKNEDIAAFTDYKAVLKLDKRNAQAHFGLGEARFRQGQYKKAIKHFKNARSLDSENPLVYQYLMLGYLARDDIKKVKKSFEKFKNVASEEQMNRLRSDSRFSAVLRVVESN